MHEFDVCRGDYGVWLAFVALLVRLFYFIPGRFSVFYNFAAFIESVVKEGTFNDLIVWLFVVIR